MSPASGSPRHAAPPDPITVRVNRTGRGAWAVAMPGQREPVTWETLDDARRICYLSAARRPPCELVVCDARHRVLRREVIDGHGDLGVR
jgi:hypothetical protein